MSYKFFNEGEANGLIQAGRSIQEAKDALRKFRKELRGIVVAKLKENGLKPEKGNNAHSRKDIVQEVYDEAKAIYGQAIGETNDQKGGLKTFRNQLNTELAQSGYRLRAAKAKDDKPEATEETGAVDTTPNDPRAALVELAGQMMKKVNKGDIDHLDVMKALLAAGLDMEAVVCLAEEFFDANPQPNSRVAA